MADLESLNYTSISDMTTDEAIEMLRQIRLSRRVPMKRAKTTRKVTKKKAEQKTDIKNLTGEQIANLLKDLGG